MTLIDICKGKTSVSECMEFTTKAFVFQYWIIGFCDALNGQFLVYAANDKRTPPFLQAVLSTLMIFWTILFRYIILRKKPSIGQTIFAIGVFYGLFLTVIPSVFGLNDNSSFKFQSTGVWKWLWSVIFGLSFIPAAIMNVVSESVLKETSQSTLKARKDSLIPNKQEIIKNVNVWYFLTMESIAQEITFLMLFWLNAIPNFGSVDTIPDIFTSLRQNWRYFFCLDGMFLQICSICTFSIYYIFHNISHILSI